MAQDVDALLKRVDTLKAEKARAEGALEAIRSKWLEELGTDDPRKVEEIVKEAEKELRELGEAYEAAMKEAESLLEKAEGSL